MGVAAHDQVAGRQRHALGGGGVAEHLSEDAGAFFDEFDVNEEIYLEGLNSFIKDAASKSILIPINKEET